MKIGIITIIDYFNYGNRLQNYAVQEILKSIGYTVETIVNTQRSSNKNTSNKLKNLSKLKNKNAMSILKTIKRRLFLIIDKKKISSLNNEKYRNFKGFTDKYINETDFIISDNYIPEYINDDYDFFIVGSDQVWNPHYRKGSSIDFLTFAHKEKRISFSASFGVSRIPDDFKEDYSKWLCDFKAISVRENAGFDIVKNLTGKEAEVLLDPTLLIQKENWINISKESKKKPSKRYILTYFLGHKNETISKKIIEIANRKDLEIVNLASIKDDKFYTCDPAEFLDFIKSAEIFFTDSFHGVVFSILFSKPFIVFKRGEMNSRIDTLLNKFDLVDRKWENIRFDEDIFKIDFSHVESILENERQKAINYLQNALTIGDAE